MPEVAVSVRTPILAHLVDRNSEEAEEIENLILKKMIDKKFLSPEADRGYLAFDWSNIVRSRAADDIMFNASYSVPSGLVSKEAAEQPFARKVADDLRKELIQYLSKYETVGEKVGVWLRPQLNAAWAGA